MVGAPSSEDTSQGSEGKKQEAPSHSGTWWAGALPASGLRGPSSTPLPLRLLGGTVVALTHPVEARAFPGLAIALIRAPAGQEASSGTCPLGRTSTTPAASPILGF